MIIRTEQEIRSLIRSLNEAQEGAIAERDAMGALCVGVMADSLLWLFGEGTEMFMDMVQGLDAIDNPNPARAAEGAIDAT